MSKKIVSLEELYKMRGDIALAALETVERDLEAIRLVLSQIKTLDTHYQLKNEVESTGVNEIVKTLRAHSPELTEGKTDAEVLALFGRAK